MIIKEVKKDLIKKEEKGMCIRLFPDIIAASEVKESLDDIVLICKNNSRVGDDNFFKEISTVYVSAERCAKRQQSYLKRGLGNAFLGFNGNDWSVDDYKNYFDGNPLYYKRVAGDNMKYGVNLGDSFINLNNLDQVQACIKSFCSKLLTQETYNPRVLEKFGLA